MAKNFTIDVLHSSVGFSVKHMMVANVKGEFNDFSGSIVYDNDKNEFKELSTTIEAKSIYTKIDKRDAHLRSADFFDVEKFTNITFKMTAYKAINANEGEITGNMTIKGITKQVILKAEINGVIKHEEMLHLGFSLSGKISRKEFGLSWNAVIETGGVMVGDEVKVSADIEAIDSK